jgi:hypothetical protein
VTGNCQYVANGEVWWTGTIGGDNKTVSVKVHEKWPDKDIKMTIVDDDNFTIMGDPTQPGTAARKKSGQ